MESPVTRLERKYERLAAEGKLTRRKIEMIERRMKQITSRPDSRQILLLRHAGQSPLPPGSAAAQL